MKKKLLCLALAVGCLFALPSCTSKNVLYTVADGDREISVLGGNKVNYLTVSENDSVVWEKRIYADRTVGNRNGTYGLQVLDINFDGLNDLIIAITADDDVTTENVYIRQSDGSYKLSGAFDEKCNLAIDAEQELIFGFLRTDKTEKDADSGKTYHVKTDTATAYSWQDNTLIPRRYVSLTYYGGSDCYCYSVADYDATAGAWERADDYWMTPEQYANETFEALYYFK